MVVTKRKDFTHAELGGTLFGIPKNFRILETVLDSIGGPYIQFDQITFYLITFTVQLVNVSQLLSSYLTDVCQFCHCYKLLCGSLNKQKGFELSPFQVHYTSRRQL